MASLKRQGTPKLPEAVESDLVAVARPDRRRGGGGRRVCDHGGHAVDVVVGRRCGRSALQRGR